MRIFDLNNNELTNVNEALGKLVDDKLLIATHDAIEAVEEQWHYEIIAEYPNGGKDIEKVIDVAGVEARAAWEEYEDIKRYIPYTEEELAEIDKHKNVPTLEEKVFALEEALTLLLEGATE